jgi:hypothetical protein
VSKPLLTTKLLTPALYNSSINSAPFFREVLNAKNKVEDGKMRRRLSVKRCSITTVVLGSKVCPPIISAI